MVPPEEVPPVELVPGEPVLVEPVVPLVPPVLPVVPLVLPVLPVPPVVVVVVPDDDEEVPVVVVDAVPEVSVAPLFDHCCLNGSLRENTVLQTVAPLGDWLEIWLLVEAPLTEELAAGVVAVVFDLAVPVLGLVSDLAAVEDDVDSSPPQETASTTVKIKSTMTASAATRGEPLNLAILSIMAKAVPHSMARPRYRWPRAWKSSAWRWRAAPLSCMHSLPKSPSPAETWGPAMARPEKWKSRLRAGR